MAAPDSPGLDPPDDETDLLAAELALRLLEGDEEAAAQSRRIADPRFRRAAERWEARLSGTFPARDEKASGRNWASISARLPERMASRTLRKLRVWRSVAVGTGALAAGLAAVLAISSLPREAAPPPVSVAQLSSDAGAPIAVALYDGAAGTVRIRPGALPQSSKEPELWLIPGDGTPRSLGLIARSGASEIALDPVQRAAADGGATLAITLERRDGAPHRAPTGAILGKAPLSAL